jgi:hypothetical protein
VRESSKLSWPLTLLCSFARVRGHPALKYRFLKSNSIARLAQNVNSSNERVNTMTPVRDEASIHKSNRYPNSSCDDVLMYLKPQLCG